MPGKSTLTADAAERAALRALSKSEQRGEADRARAVLLTLEGRKAAEIAAVLGVHVSTVRNWRGYFVHGGVAGLRRRQRPGQQAKIGPHAGAIAAANCRPAADQRGPEDYKRHLAGELTRRALAVAARRAGQLSPGGTTPRTPRSAGPA